MNELTIAGTMFMRQPYRISKKKTPRIDTFNLSFKDGSDGVSFTGFGVRTLDKLSKAEHMA